MSIETRISDLEQRVARIPDPAPPIDWTRLAPAEMQEYLLITDLVRPCSDGRPDYSAITDQQLERLYALLQTAVGEPLPQRMYAEGST